MEDKNLEPLQPDMLYRHTLPDAQPEPPEPETIPLEAFLLNDLPAAEEIPVDTAEAPSADTFIPEEPIPQVETPAAQPRSDPDSSEEITAAEEPIVPSPESEIQEIPLAAFLPAQDIDFPEEPSPEPQEAQPAEDALDAFIPEEDISFAEAPLPIGDTQPISLVSEPLPEAGQPICTDDTLAWLIGEESGTGQNSSPAEGNYHTVEPETRVLPPVESRPISMKPEFTDMQIDRSGEEEPPPTKKKTAPAVKKGRPKRKKGYGLFGIPHILATILWLAIIVAIGSALGKLLWIGAADVLAFGRESKIVTVEIVDSDTIDTIAAKLKDAGLVKYPELFKFYAKLTGAEEEITTGTFEVNTILDYHALTNALSPSSSNRTVVKVTIPEGYSCRQIFNLLAASNVCSVELLEEYAANGELPEYWFLEGVARGDRYCLEGYLFPDTYEFYVNSTPRETLSRMLSGFNSRFTEEMRTQVDALNVRISDMMRADGKSEEYIASHQLTVRDVLIVASLVEEETAGTAESATIASVIYNRLFSWGDTPAYLNIDAAIYYALDGNIDPATGNTMVLTKEDLKIDSPYNTYAHTGLTPGPITNPGLASLQAALEPGNTGYYYYVLNPETSLHQFSSTLEEHEKWVEKFYPGSGGEE